MSHKKVENIIFDLGGVIINLDVSRAFQKFSEIFSKELKTDIFTDKENYPFFKDYELGRIGDEEFRSCIKELAEKPVTDSLVDEAWNAMLLDIPAERIGWIYEATKSYNCVVLSNTNAIHVSYFEQFFSDVTPYGHPGTVFQKLYYSHQIGERKPNKAAFEIVLDDAGFDPEETVLFDDLKDNLAAANELGIITEYVERNNLKRDQLLKLDGRQ